MTKAIILCESCNKKYTIEAKYPSDLYHIKCPKCETEENVWILDNGFKTDGKGVELGWGGCSQK